MQQELENVRNNYKLVLERVLGDEHRRLLVDLMDRGVIPFNKVDFSTISFLIKTTFVRADDARGGYVINGTLFETYLREQILPYRRSL